MKSSKMLFLATIAMIGSFSVTKTEFTLEKKFSIAHQSLKNAINSCDTAAEHQDICDKNNEYSKNFNLFLAATASMTMSEIVTLINGYADETTKKAEAAPCYNCKYLAKDITYMTLRCNDAVKMGKGSVTYFEASVPHDEQYKLAQTISQFLAEAKEGDSVPEEIMNLYNEGKGHLTVLQACEQGFETQLREALNLTQSNK